MGVEGAGEGEGGSRAAELLQLGSVEVGDFSKVGLDRVELEEGVRRRRHSSYPRSDDIMDAESQNSSIRWGSRILKSLIRCGWMLDALVHKDEVTGQRICKSLVRCCFT